MIVKLIIIAASLLLSVATAVKPIFLQNAIDACAQRNVSDVKVQFGIYVCSVVGIIVFEACRQLSLGKFQVKKTNELKKQIIGQVTRIPPRDFNKESGQNYLTIINQEVDMVVANYHIQKLDFMYSVLVLVTSVAALIYINYMLAGLILLFTFLPIFASMLQGKRMQARTNIYTKALEKLNVWIGNFIHGYPTLKVNRADTRYEHLVGDGIETAGRKAFDETKTRTFINMTIGVLAYMGELILVGAGLFLILRGTMTFGSLVAALQMSEMLAIPTNSIAYQINEMNAVKGIKKKIETFMQTDTHGEETKRDCPKIEKIELKQVTFCYEGTCILKNVNLCFEAGKKYLIVGENGSGKSTLFKLISKFEDNYEGEILVNGVELRQINSSFFDQVGVALQRTFLMNDSIFHNITLYDARIRKADVLSVLKQLGMDKFMSDDVLMGEYQDTKDNLSGGEKQKIALARLLLQKKKFILLDEATSAIDAVGSRNIEQRFLEDASAAVINIEHKIIPELLSYYDEVLEVKNGSIKKIK